MRMIDADALIDQIETNICKPCKERKRDCNGVWCRACQFGDEIDDIYDAPTVGEWIPCSERLPNDGEEVFVYLYNASPYIAWVKDGHWYTEEFEVEEENEPKAWMPLPEPYNKEELNGNKT